MSFLSDIFGGAAKRAAGEQVKGLDNQINYLKSESDRTRQDFAPYIQAGLPALAQYQRGIGNYGPEGVQESLDLFHAADPSFQFGLDTGLKALNNRAASRGLSSSGKQYQDLIKYGTDYGTQRYDTWLGKERDLAGLGQASAGGQAAATSPYTQAIGTAYSDQGTAKASGIIGATNARLGVISQIANAAGQWFGLGSGGGGLSSGASGIASMFGG